MDALQVVCWIIAAVLFAVAAFMSPPRVGLLPLGLLFFVAGFLVPALS